MMIPQRKLDVDQILTLQRSRRMRKDRVHGIGRRVDVSVTDTSAAARRARTPYEVTP